MEENFDEKIRKNFISLWILYISIAFYINILPVNIDNLLYNLPGTTKFGLGVAYASHLAVSMISLLFFGYYGEKLFETGKFSRKKVFVFTNLIWVLAFGSIAFSLNYNYFLLFSIISAIGTGAFIPIGFSIIGDSFQPQDRGQKFGFMQFGVIMGSGGGIIVGGLLGTYAGPNGWRLAYGLGGILGLLALCNYIFRGIIPERGRTEPEFEDFEGVINYNYKITYNNLSQLLRKKSIAAILIYLICAGIAITTLGIWAIFYLSTKIKGPNAELIITAIYLLAGIGAIPGSILGGKLGDTMYKAGKSKGRIIISMGGLVLGSLCFLGFYLIPFHAATPLQFIISFIFFVSIGFFAFFFTTLPAGNIYAIYSEVSLPELRSTANALNGLMLNIGGIIGNLLFSSLIEKDMGHFPFAISLILLIWLVSTSLWIIPYFSYPKESKLLRNKLAERREKLERSSFKNNN